jgi:pectate lyase
MRKYRVSLRFAAFLGSLLGGLGLAAAGYAQLGGDAVQGPEACVPGMIRGMVDCQGKVVGTSCNGDDESQQPVFTLAEGAVIKNVTLSPDAADGIHCLGNCILENVVWQDVCEDAATMRGGPGTTMFIIGGSAAEANDKVFQHNGIGSTIEIMDFKTTGSIGKLYRSCGDCTGNGGPRRVNITNVVLENVRSSVAGVNSNFGDVAAIRNLQIRAYEKGEPKVCEEFRGVVKGDGDSESIGEAFGSRSCDIRETDVTAIPVFESANP